MKSFSILLSCWYYAVHGTDMVAQSFESVYEILNCNHYLVVLHCTAVVMLEKVAQSF